MLLEADWQTVSHWQCGDGKKPLMSRQQYGNYKVLYDPALDPDKKHPKVVVRWNGIYKVGLSL